MRIILLLTGKDENTLMDAQKTTKKYGKRERAYTSSPTSFRVV